MRRLNVSLLVICLMLSLNGYAQHQTVYSNYVYNKLLINPAYIGPDDLVTASAAFKKNWVGIEGAPTSKIITIHSPVKLKKIALGLVITNDRLGVTDETNIQAIYSYRIYLKKHVFALGLQPSLAIYSQRFSELRGTNPNDPNFSGSDFSDVSFNLGLGAYLHHKKYYIGMSLPRSANDFFNQGENSFQNFKQVRQLLFHSGYLLDINEYVKFQPNFFVRYASNLPMQINLNTTFIFNERILLGASFHALNTLEGNFGIQMNKELMFTYSYGYALKFENQVNSGAHEVMLKYSFKRAVNTYISTRYF